MADYLLVTMRFSHMQNKKRKGSLPENYVNVKIFQVIMSKRETEHKTFKKLINSWGK